MNSKIGKFLKEISQKIDKKYCFVILGLMVISFFFGVYKIQDAALTDEHYWIFDRSPKFWENILEHDANGTRRSDKPGETLMVLLGPSVLKTGFLHDRDSFSPKEISEINFLYRLPVLLFATFSLIAFYFLLSKLFGNMAGLFGSVFIGLSPILIGMSRVVNPDALLWIFCCWAILAFFLYLDTKKKKWLIASGVSMGLALLTKYVATILFVYLLGVVFLEFIYQKDKKQKYLERKVFKKTAFTFIIFCLLALATFAILYPAVWVKWSRLPLGTFTSQAFEPIWPLFAGLIGAIFADILLFRNFIFTWILGFLKRYKELLARIIFGFFALIGIVVLLNVYVGNSWFDFEDVLSSPKSAYLSHGAISIFLANFYPLIFGVSPIVLFCVGWLLIKGALGKLDLDQKKNKYFLYLTIFILLYHLSSVFSQVASTIRYQIVLYPIFLVLGAIGALDIFEHFKFQDIKKKVATFTLLAVFLIASLFFSAPYYMAYASFLLPGKYYLDQKDMGYGSYEAAVYLNSLPDAKDLLVWTDKKGVCDFFVGECTSNLDFKDLKKIKFDYYVVSAGRFSRTERLVMVRVNTKSPNTIRFDKLYKITNPEWSLRIGGRKSNFVKVIKADTIDIYTID